MKILSYEQIRQADQYTMRHEPIASIDLMEKAARACFDWIIVQHRLIQRPFFVLAGTGNNGGDGLALARMLLEAGIQVNICIACISNRHTIDFQTNRNRLEAMNTSIKELHLGDPLPYPHQGTVLIDALFGIGLSRPVGGYWSNLIDHFNKVSSQTISIDIPSGLFVDKLAENPRGIIRAEHTLSFQTPKLPFLLPDTARYVGAWHLLDIGWSPEATEKADTQYYYVDKRLARSIYKPRKKFSHKGTFGHGLIIGGSHGMIGAVALSAQGCLRSGVGKLSIYTPACGYQILQTSVPEALIWPDAQTQYINYIPTDLAVEAIGIGPGLGKAPQTAKALKDFLSNTHVPLVIDADAINLLSDCNSWVSKISDAVILTPHPKEFSQLVGGWKNDDQKLNLLRKFASINGFYVVLKGAHTITATPQGEFFFNSTGNPGMATAGSGDVLTGVITGLLAQKYSPKEACMLGVYLHGLAGDIAARHQGEESLIAGDIAKNMGRAYQTLKCTHQKGLMHGKCN